ncbi:odorant receptor 131-2-like [Mugil cephalus]|uniref:odorant receptor 131-2-like n=1 Tax=Mugil cephalus TaxID=48193 RepID=UPI001FB6DB8C|nr:odorant receptor 131-2-like [Mugil cephalus]
MAANSSLVYDALLSAKFKVIFAEILVLVFLCINLLLIVIYFKKECFHTTARYILFAVTLLSDSLLLFITDLLLFLTFFYLKMQVWMCIIIVVLIILYITVTPVTLTAMTLERYVAICMPLRHAELCSTRSTMNCILIIHCISAVPCIVILSAFFASASLSFYKEERICTVEVFMLHEWQDHLRSAISQFYFFIMCIIIIFSYAKIMKVAKAASGENKKSTQKGLRTVVLHSFQLLLCLIQLWCPFIEAAMFNINFKLFEHIRYFNYIVFYIAPRCLSPLIYGLRDDMFFRALKNSLLSHKRNLI